MFIFCSLPFLTLTLPQASVSMTAPPPPPALLLIIWLLTHGIFLNNPLHWRFLLKVFFSFLLIKDHYLPYLKAYECNLTLERLRQEDHLEFEAGLGYSPIF